MYLSLTPNGGAEYVLIDAATNPTMRPWVVTGQEWGNPKWEHEFSGPRGTQGARASKGTLPNRTVRLALRLYGTSDDDAAAKQSELSSVMEQMRRFGGTITRRTHRQSYRQHMEVLTTSGMDVPARERQADVINLVNLGLEFVCAPYAVGDPMAWVQTFATAADLATLEIASGSGALSIVTDDRLRVSATDRHFLIDELRGYQYGDVRVDVNLVQTGAPTADWQHGAVLHYIDALNWLAVTVERVSGTNYLRVRSMVAGTETVVASTTGPFATTEGYTWLSAWISGNAVGGEFRTTSSPSPYNEHGAPTHTVAANLSVATGLAVGYGTTGRVGMIHDRANTTDVATTGILAWRCQPFYMPGQWLPAQGQLPLVGPIPGDAPALTEVAITTPAAWNATNPTWALVGWANRRSGRNFCWNGSFEDADVTGWSVAAVAGVCAAATTVATTAVSRYGGLGAYFSSTASDTSGASFRMWERFRKGNTYRATVWVLSSIGATAELCLGVSGDLAVTAPTLLTASYVQLSIDWTPTADTTSAYVCLRTDGTTVTAVWFDAVQVFDLMREPTAPTQTQGRGGYSPLQVVPAVGHEQESGTTDTAATSLVGTVEDAGAIAGAGSLALSYIVDPALIDPDDYAQGGVDVEVWARVSLDYRLTGLRGAVWANPPAAAYNADTLGGRRSSAPGGLAGRPITVPLSADANRLVRLGTVQLSVDDQNPGAWRITVVFTWATGSLNSFAVDYVAFVPARSRILSPTNVEYALGGFPDFIATNADEVTKTIRSDLSAVVNAPPRTAQYPDHGLGGSSLLELPAGDVDLVVLLSDIVPDDPGLTNGTASAVLHGSVSVSPTPRWAQLRPA